MKQIGLFTAGIVLLLGTACSPKTTQYVFSGNALGTSYAVKVVAGKVSGAQRERIRKTIEEHLGDVNSKMSTYLESSELSRFNHSDSGTAFRLSPETLRVFLAARQIGEQTGGAFDITVGPLVDAWGFGPSGRGSRIPSPAEVKQLEKLTGWDKIVIDKEASTIWKTAPGVRCDLSGIAKGYAVDEVSDAISDLGFTNYMVEVGGEVRTSGRNQSGKPWQIAIEKPVAGVRAIERVIPLADLAMATSGDYRNFYEAHGVRLPHIIDPRTGRPVRHRLASVSVVTAQCMKADGYATALMVLGEEEGFDLASKLDLAVLFLTREGGGRYAERATPRFEKLFGEASGRGAGKGGVRK